MFGFSLQKLLVLASIIGAVWYGFKLVGRMQEARELDRKKPGAPKHDSIWRRATRAKSKSSGQAAEDMVQCPTCQTYVTAQGTGSCGRPDCPY